ncbi:hypothetical protein HRD49_18570 [Corallococcus exiguus]|uniref:Uncharacterized protein n=1 Tax=Corallococcus exiguus TaxID=83462 RepID=A0A7Y1S0V9_9BACT|nr:MULTISPECIES: hypothetical protein [Corallococcus]NBC40430.1 hypothetical protein [Corallococcus exiguus]NNC16011.1 hypothetical protein [Corallococcus exiguus]NRD63759.1 hypothetical protein [Corallococcus exiguus]RKH26482.1 hypothetical protein D7V77_14635 [Corallococcus sp. CA041A]RKI11991.1 hypothetical protein D7Y15_19105 [Corallococcus sp. AB030]
MLLLSASGCVKEITSDERLERDTRSVAVKDAPGVEALSKLTCDDTSAPLNKARDVNRPESDRLVDYVNLYSSLKDRTHTFEEAMSRNPDLSYREGSQNLVNAKDACIQQTADVRVEFETYLRELVAVPTVQEIKGGNTVTVARLDFGTLKKAIETLDPDDRESLLQSVNSAEKRVSATVAPAEDTSTGSGKRRGK